MTCLLDNGLETAAHKMTDHWQQNSFLPCSPPQRTPTLVPRSYPANHAPVHQVVCKGQSASLSKAPGPACAVSRSACTPEDPLSPRYTPSFRGLCRPSCLARQPGTSVHSTLPSSAIYHVTARSPQPSCLFWRVRARAAPRRGTRHQRCCRGCGFARIRRGAP